MYKYNTIQGLDSCYVLRHSKSPSQYNVLDLEAYLTGKWISKNAPKKLKYGNLNQRTTVRRRDLGG